MKNWHCEEFKKLRVPGYNTGSNWYQRHGHFFMVSHDRFMSTTLRCAVKLCPARWNQKKNQFALGPIHPNHNHQPHKWMRDRNIMYSNMKRRIAEEDTNITLIYEQEAARYPDAAKHMPFRTIKWSLRNWRKRVKPSNGNVPNIAHVIELDDDDDDDRVDTPEPTLCTTDPAFVPKFKVQTSNILTAIPQLQNPLCSTNSILVPVRTSNLMTTIPQLFNPICPTNTTLVPRFHVRTSGIITHHQLMNPLCSTSSNLSLGQHRPSFEGLPQLSLGQHKPSIEGTPQLSLGQHRPSIEGTPQLSLDQHRPSIEGTPKLSLDRPSIEGTPQLSLDQHRPTIEGTPQFSLGQHKPSIEGPPHLLLGQHGPSIEGLPLLSLGQHGPSIEGLPQLSLGQHGPSMEGLPQLLLGQHGPSIEGLPQLSLGQHRPSIEGTLQFSRPQLKVRADLMTEVVQLQNPLSPKPAHGPILKIRRSKIVTGIPRLKKPLCSTNPPIDPDLKAQFELIDDDPDPDAESEEPLYQLFDDPPSPATVPARAPTTTPANPQAPENFMIRIVKCRACCEDVPWYVFIPCGHVICRKCFDLRIRYRHMCYVCCTTIERPLRMLF